MRRWILILAALTSFIPSAVAQTAPDDAVDKVAALRDEAKADPAGFATNATQPARLGHEANWTVRFLCRHAPLPALPTCPDDPVVEERQVDPEDVAVAEPIADEPITAAAEDAAETVQAALDDPPGAAERFAGFVGRGVAALGAFLRGLIELPMMAIVGVIHGLAFLLGAAGDGVIAVVDFLAGLARSLGHGLAAGAADVGQGIAAVGAAVGRATSAAASAVTDAIDGLADSVARLLDALGEDADGSDPARGLADGLARGTPAEGLVEDLPVRVRL